MLNEKFKKWHLITFKISKNQILNNCIDKEEKWGEHAW